MRVLYIITKANEIGGAQIHLRDLAIRLSSEGHFVDVIVGETGLLVEQLKMSGINVHILSNIVREISPFKDIRAVFQIRALIKKIAPDIIGLHSSKAGILGRIAAWGLNIPVVFTVHGWAFANGVKENRRKIYILIEKFLAPLVDKIITVSEQDKKLALKYGVASSDKQVVIHNGMPDLGLKAKIKNGDDTISIISVARFSDQKDHETLLEAMSKITSINWKLLLIGKGPNENLIRNKVKDLKLNSRVSFLGERDDVAKLLHESDVFVLSTNWEGLPLSIIEAMRSSLPVIATDVGGVSELIENGCSGYLVPHKDADELRRKIQYVLSNSELRLEVGQQARARYSEKFTFDKMYQSTIALYELTIKNKR